MTEVHALLNAMDATQAAEVLTRCCGARRWVSGMLARRPFHSREALYQAAEQVWESLKRADILEAFSHHPQIGEDVAALRARFAATADWSEGEQAGVASADAPILQALAEANRAYRERFGYIFIVCATGKSAPDMLALLRTRMVNDADTELRVAATEQAKITRLRLDKLV